MKVQMPTRSELKKQRPMIVAALLTAIGILLFNFLWLAPTMSANEDIEAQVKQSKALAQKLKSKLDQAQSIRENLVKQETELKALQKSLFRGTDPYQLAASLSDLLASKSGQKLDMKTYQVLANKEYGLYQEVHLRFNFMTTVEGFHFFLDRVKNFQTAILIHEINIQKVQRKSGPDLVINVILAALMEKGEKS